MDCEHPESMLGSWDFDVDVEENAMSEFEKMMVDSSSSSSSILLSAFLIGVFRALPAFVGLDECLEEVSVPDWALTLLRMRFAVRQLLTSWPSHTQKVQ